MNRRYMTAALIALATGALAACGKTEAEKAAERMYGEAARDLEKKAKEAEVALKKFEEETERLKKLYPRVYPGTWGLRNENKELVDVLEISKPEGDLAKVKSYPFGFPEKEGEIDFSRPDHDPSEERKGLFFRPFRANLNYDEKGDFLWYGASNQKYERITKEEFEQYLKEHQAEKAAKGLK